MTDRIVVPQPITYVKRHFNRIMDELDRAGSPPTIVSNHGRPVAAIIRWEDYQRYAQWKDAQVEGEESS